MSRPTIKIEMELSIDSPNGLNYSDTYTGLENPWYKIEHSADRGVVLIANQDGFEHLARVFLKLARTPKDPYYHSHHALEFGHENFGPPEFTIALSPAPD